ncbi:MAG TPA: FKBP-type peptidyl-prolyl cis-trans isomerase [Xanthomonadaceae bacterium]|nr:FKBP-type peptidyl-prolyl cis-trans isomerase [Xanthomonadaceae bacterium]
MQSYSRRTAPVAFAVLAVAFSTAAFAAPQASSGLTTDKDKVSYAIGMQIGNSLDQVKGDVDPAILTRAITTSLNGGKSLMTVEEAKVVLADYGKKIQAKQLAAKQAAGMKNLSEGSAFLTANKKKPGVVTTASGLQYTVLKAGTGPKPKATDSVKVNYTGQTLDGKTFDSSSEHGGPAVMALNSVISGWTEGVQLMPVGSKYEFWIPAPLAYGENGTPGGPIGPNATLHFQIELLSIGNK